MKISGFTIMEIMVGFVLTGIVITAAYFGLEVVLKTKFSINNEQKVVKNQSAMFTVISRDFFEAYTISGTEEKIKIVSKSNNLNYLLEDTLIIRESVKNDTLYQGAYDKKINFFARNYINEMILIIDTSKYYFSKQYDLKTKLDLEH